MPKTRLYFLIGLHCSGQLLAATINVTTTSDQIADTGTCSLREAIIAANTNAPSGATAGECASGSSSATDTINVPAGTYLLSLVGSEGSTATNAAIGDLDLTQRVTIIGAGTTTTIVDGLALNSRILHLDASTESFSISQLTIRNGATSGDGGGIFVESASSLSLADLRIQLNSAESDGGGLAVWATASTITMSRVDLQGNEARWSGGGGFFQSAALQLQDTQITGNQAFGPNGQGGGVLLDSGTVTISRSTVSENISENDGGGVYLRFGSLTLIDSDVENNIAGRDGGGVYFLWGDASSFTNCTIGDNHAVEEGGGIVVGGVDNLTLTHVTVAGNTAPLGSALVNGEVTLRNSILAGTCSGDPATSQGGNIESPGDNCGLVHATDQIAISSGSLGLAPLAYNGGATRTRMPSATSVALDMARSIYCTASDQRGTPRPQGPACDVGAVERVPGWLFYCGFEEGDMSAWSSHVP